jgi:hypothetical protein
MGDYYTRSGDPISLLEWASTFGKEDNHVGDDEVDGVRVSTVYLGLDHSFGVGPPLIFETMIFGGPHDQWTNRYSTEEEARRFHADVVEALREGREP